MKIKKLVIYTGIYGSLVLTSVYAGKNYEVNFDSNIHYECGDEHDGYVVAHRGFSSKAKENSYKAFTKALDSDCVDSIEIDVRPSKDGEVVLSHDAYIEDVGKVCKTNCDTLKEFGITSLEEVLDEKPNKNVLIDIKFGQNDNRIFMSKIDYILRKYDDLDITLQACNYDELLKMKELYPDYKYQLIIKDKESLKYIYSDFNRFAIKESIIDKKVIEECLLQNKMISIWTVNSKYEYNYLKGKLGDELFSKVAIITDYPDEICNLNNEKEKVLIR